MITFIEYFLESRKENFDAQAKRQTDLSVEKTPFQISELENSINSEVEGKNKKNISDQIELHKLQLEYAQRGVHIDPTIYKINGHIRPGIIYVPKNLRGQGIGSEVLRKLTDIADKQNRIIVITPDSKLGASSVNRLIKFYQRFGFVKNSGRHKDFSISETMYRIPKR